MEKGSPPSISSETGVEKKPRGLRVYARLKPRLEEEEEEEFRNVKTRFTYMKNEILTDPQGGVDFSQHFEFTRIFAPNVDQSSFFREMVLERLEAFLSGENQLIFTYGATSSGKTFTVQGTPASPGILPRSLDLIFNSLGVERFLDRSPLLPHGFDSVQISACHDKLEREKKEVLSLGRFLNTQVEAESESGLSECDSICTDVSAQSLATMFPSLGHRERENTKVSKVDREGVYYSLWVSFAEIYNENIYDLFQKIPLPSNKEKVRRLPLKLAEDRKGSIYIKGLKEVQVSSADEAYQLLLIGRKNLQFAATKLNHNSSRSHCIFTIKMMKFCDSNEPKYGRVSILSFCDLAGSERIKKTQNDLKRQKETGNINTSLLVLGRVMKALRDNQYIKDLKKHSVVPFRDSKLTRLLQVFFKGLGQASMIVNISQAPYLFDETLQALKFAAITSKIKYVREFKTPKSKRRSTFSSILFEHKRTSNLFGRGSIAWENPIISSTIQHPQILNEETEEHEQEDESSLISNSCPDQFEALTDLVTQLRQRLNEEMDKNMTLETEIRSELCSKFDTMMLQNEQQWQKRLQESTDRIENLSSWRITQLENAYNECRKRKRYEQTDEDNSNRIATLETALDVKITELGESDKQFKAMKETYNSLLSVKQKLQEDLTFFKFENQSFKTRIQRLEDKNIALSQENKSKDLAIESMSTKPILIDLRNQLSDTKNKLSKKNEEVSYFKKLLDEAGEEFIAKDDELQKMTLDISSLRTECTKLTLALRDAQHEYSILISESNHRQEEKENLEEQVINFRTEVTELLAEKSNLILELSNLKKEKLTSGQKLERNVILKDSEENEKELNRRILKLEDENRTIKEDFELFKDKAELRIEDFQITLQNAMDTSEALLAKNNELKSKISLLESEVSVLGSLSSPCGKERQKDILPDMSVLETKEFENVEHKIITEELDNVRKVLEEKDTIIKTNNKSLSERDKEIEKVHARISELKCGLHKSDKEISSLNNKVEENASYIQQLENIIVDKDYEITLAEEKIANYEKKENERSSIDEKLSSTSEELKKTIKELDKYKIVNEELEKSLKKIHDERDRKEKDLNDEIESLRQSKVKIKASDDEKTKLLSDKELEISSLQKEVKHLIQTDVANRQMIDNQNSELKVLEVQIKKLNEETKDCKVLGKKIGEQQNQIDSLKNQLNSKEREENMIEILKEELDSKNLEKNKLLDKISQLESKVIDASQLSELQLKISHLEEEIHSKNEEIRQARNQREATMFTYSKAFKTKEEEISRLKQESTRIRDVIIRSSPTKNNVASSLKNELEKKGVTIKILEEQVQQSLDVNVETQENSLKSEIDSLKCQISRANNKHSREIEKIKRTNGKVIQEYKDANRELQKQIGLTSNISDDSLQKSMLEADESLNVSVEISSKIKTKKKGRVRSARKKSRISESSTLSPISSTSAKGNFDNNTEEGTEGDENIPYNTRNSSQITLSVRKPRRKYVNMEDNFKETPRKGRSTLKNVGNSDISIDNSIPIPTPRRSTRKTLYNPGKLEVFSPVQDLEESNSSPHTIVKRQLRARKKKLAS